MNSSFTCEATGYPVPTVTWHRVDGSSTDGLLINDNILTGDGRMIAYLMIANASKEHTGAYTCTANNSISSDSRIIRIVGKCANIVALIVPAVMLPYCDEVDCCLL